MAFLIGEYECTLTEPSCGLAATVVSSNISCNGLANGAFAMNIVGANLPLTYTWTGPTAIGNTNTANNLRAGLYSGTLTDAALCKVVVNFTITEPLILKDTLIQLTISVLIQDCSCARAVLTCHFDVPSLMPSKSLIS